VARRVRAADEVATAGAGRAVRYRAALAAADAGAVFLHPTSALHGAAPEWLVYTELLATGARPYMLGATAIEPAWLPAAAPRLCTLSAPLAQPPPRYSAQLDAVVAQHAVLYGPPAWELPPATRPLGARGPHADLAVAAFAAALLGGSVLAAFGPALAERLAAPAATAARPEARSQRRVGELLHALKRRGVASRAGLAAAWRAEAKFLQPELLGWMRAGQGHVLLRAWPQMVAAEPAGEAPHKKRKVGDEA